MKNKELRYNNLRSEIDMISKVAVFGINGKLDPFRAEALKTLKQDFSRFIADYSLLDTEIYYALKYNIEQL